MTLTVASLASGSDGNALLIRHGTTALLIDCGLSLRRLEPLLCAAGVPPAALTAILLTHEHGDHSQCAGTLARRHNVPVVCNTATRDALAHMLANAPGETLPIGERATIGSLNITSFAVPHDAAAPVGYCVAAEDGAGTVGVAIDLGSWNDDLLAALRPADLLVIEANHSSASMVQATYPWAVCQRILGPHGHLANSQTAQLLAALGSDGKPRDVRLAHLSPHANRPHDALKTVQQTLHHAGVSGLRLAALPPLAELTHRKLPLWTSDSLLRQQDMFSS